MPISEPTIELDLTGLKCPLPVLKTQKMLKSMDPKHILQVWTTDPMAAIDIPHFCAEKGYELIEAEQHQMDGIEKLCFTIRNK